MSNRPEVKVVEVPAPLPASPPLAFQVAYVSVALFAGPVVFAVVVGGIALLAWLCGAMVGLVRQGVGT